jgi:hypothetical protein
MRTGGTALRLLVVAGGVLAYGYWATAQAPFRTSAYLAVGLPVALVGLAVLIAPEPLARKRNSALVSLRSAWPWLAIAGLMAGLEIVGLALGGRSTTVPTLSTVVDHALAWHLVRLLLFGAWLSIGWSLVGGHRLERRR